MSGPLQWTANGFVPANGTLPNAGVTKPGFVEDTNPFMPAVPNAEEIVRRITAPKPKPPSTPVNVVAMAKARLKEIKAELRRLKALEKEKGELERLIAAAEAKPPKSNLREIKRSIG